MRLFSNVLSITIPGKLSSEYGKEERYASTFSFSFVIYDAQEKSLYGARDHFGIKPFYYYKDDEDPFLNPVKAPDIILSKYTNFLN